MVCWGGHSIPREEYDYTKQVGYELGLRGLNVCTGCGPGAMKGPMKGATIGHSKQRIRDGRYIGMTEPGIIAAEPPNPIVNQLVIMPDIEKRLEAFVRLCHGIVVFPGGAGTAEEILYLLGILLDPENADQPLPVVFTGPARGADYFRQIDASSAPRSARSAAALLDRHRRPGPGRARDAARLDAVRHSRRRASDAYNYNWLLRIPRSSSSRSRSPTKPWRSSKLTMDQPARAGREPAARVLRHRRRQRQGTRHPPIEEIGPVRNARAPEIAGPLDELLRAFVAQRRMKLAGEYRPCYRIV